MDSIGTKCFTYTARVKHDRMILIKKTSDISDEDFTKSSIVTAPLQDKKIYEKASFRTRI